jgi:hypothetical protein
LEREERKKCSEYQLLQDIVISILYSIGFGEMQGTRQRQTIEICAYEGGDWHLFRNK